MSNDLALLTFFEISAESVRYRGEFEKRMEKLLKELTGLREEVDSKTGSLGVLGCFIQICWDLHKNYWFLTSWKPTQLWQKIGFQQIHPKTSLYRKLHPYQATYCSPWLERKQLHKNLRAMQVILFIDEIHMVGAVVKIRRLTFLVGLHFFPDMSGMVQK